MQKKISIVTLIAVSLLCCLATFMATFLAMKNEDDKAFLDRNTAVVDNETKETESPAVETEPPAAETESPATEEPETTSPVKEPSTSTSSNNKSDFMDKVVEKLSIVDSYFRNYYIGELDDEALLDGIIAGYVEGTGDVFAAYYNAAEFQEYMNDYNAELVGIGVNVIYNTDYETLEIISVVPESPALEAGLLPGDLIYTVGEDRELASELGYYPTINKLRGEVGTEAVFSVLRGKNYTEEIEFRIIRQKITEITVMSHVYDLDDSIGIIKITGFDAKTPVQFISAVEELQNSGCDKLVIDLRYNPGGELQSICSILDYIVPDGGPIIHIIDGNGKEVDAEYANDGHELNIPMVVLVNGSTASAAELFTATVRDYNKATIVGTTTYGKGCMQTTIPIYSNMFTGKLYDGSAVTITYRMYDPPFSDNYHGVGIVPDVVVELDEALREKNIYKITDEEDNQLRAAVATFNK